MPPVFGLIQELGEISDEEMHEVFNMGLGFVAIVPEADADAAVELCGAPPGHARDRLGYGPSRVGRADLAGRDEGNSLGLGEAEDSTNTSRDRGAP